jgi:hypothetical protein
MSLKGRQFQFLAFECSRWAANVKGKWGTRWWWRTAKYAQRFASPKSMR